MPIKFSFTNQGKDYFAKTDIDEKEFFVGKDVTYEGKRGLNNLKRTPGLIYIPTDYETQFGFWSHFIYPTVVGESIGSFYCLNTYDRARFTFGFMQYAAHVPNGDFVKYFRDLLKIPAAKNYFPLLDLKENRICFKSDNGLIPLENDNSTEELMHYLNPDLVSVQNQELLCAARFIHWVSNDAEHRKIMVEGAINLYKNNMRNYSLRFNLNGVPEKVCLVICDILHQGRGKYSSIEDALDTDGDFEKAYEKLLAIGSHNYAERVNTIRQGVKKLIQKGIFGNKKYDQKSGEFK